MLKNLYLRTAALFFFITLTTPSLFAQNTSASLWQDISLQQLSNAAARETFPVNYRLLELNTALLHQVLLTAPPENSVAAAAQPLLIDLPSPAGGFHTFSVEETQVLHPADAAQFPDIKTYIIKGVTDVYAAGRIDVTLWGFHGMVLAPGYTTIIDPYAQGDTAHYLCFFRKDMPRTSEFNCTTESGPEEDAQFLQLQLSLALAERSNGTQLRTYRLALACTGEYATFHGGTVAGANAAMVTSVNRVSGVLEKEMAIRLVLIANNQSLIYTNAGSDPYTNNSGTTMLTENQNNITTVIGSANYDIGHVFSTGGGGVASLQSVCSSTNKARGVTGSSSPVGDAFDIDYVAHEIGHQFGGNHTFNCTTGSCNGNRSASAAYEPGSGSTIMAYAGICTATNNLQSNSDVYYHAKSFDEMIIFSVTGNGNTCAVKTNTNNNPPVINAGANYIIPFQTPFKLTGSATDPNGDPLTYCWEQYNLGNSGNWNAPAGDAPIFRSFNPDTAPFRIFPKMSDIVNNTTTIGEILPTYARTLQFKLTARDNRAAGGGVTNNDTTVKVDVINTTTPFRVTNPNTALTWAAGSTQTVTWDVSNTTASPISCANVKISLSTDGGYNYPITLVASTPNDGSETVLVPNNPSTTARVKVEAVGNIFFDISNTNFTITASVGPLTAITTQAFASNSMCQGQTITVNFVPNGAAVSGNQFIAELSNASGSFASPVTIGTLTSTSATSMSATIPANTPLGSGYRIRVRSTNPAITGTDNGANITVGTLPGNAGAITGASTVCAGQTGVSYSISAVAGANSYNWVLPSGATITAGSGTNNITVSFPAGFSSGTITATPVNSCGNGGTSPTLLVNSSTSSIQFNGPSTVCPGESGVAFSVNAQPGNPTYTWILPSGVSIASGAGTAAVQLNFAGNAQTGFVKVRFNGTCGVDSAFNLVTVGGVPAAPAVSAGGNTSFCAGDSVVLSTTPAAGLQYQWLQNNIPINGATGSTYTAKQTGSYTLSAAYPALNDTIFTNSTAANIPSNSCTGATSTITISGLPESYPASAVSALMNITHGYVGDLAIFLISPQGNTLGLVNRTGNVNNSGDNLINTEFNDFAPAAMPTTGAPYTGQYLPVSPVFTSCLTSTNTTFLSLGNAGYINPNGNWTLRVFDRAGSNGGTLNNWQLKFAATSGCEAVSNVVAVTANPQPQTFNVGGGGNTCSNGTGVSVTLSGSQQNVSYQLIRNGSNVGSPLSGTGAALVFNGNNVAGTYTIVASGPGNCTATMSGNAVVTITSSQTWYADADNDGFGNPAVSQQSCTALAGYVNNNLDCNDNNAAINPNTVWYLDADNDSYYSGTGITQCTSPGNGYTFTVTGGNDCNDSLANINPASAEVCDGADNNCNNQTDEGLTTTYYQDSDGDQFGNAGVSIQACTAPQGYVSDNTDCDDTNADINPNTVWYLDADNDNYYTGAGIIQCSSPGNGYTFTVTGGNDCNDSLANINPASAEVCDGADNNCNNQTDEGLTSTYYQDSDGDLFGNAGVSIQACTAPQGYVSDNTDCDDTNADINPNTVWYMDADNDNYYTGAGIIQCSSPGNGYTYTVTGGNDCNDSLANINPGSAEVCDGADNNCNNQTDEGLLVTWYQDNDGDQFGNPNVSVQNCNAPQGYVTNSQDCDDTDDAINPNTIWYLDADQDEYYTGNGVNQCLNPGNGYTLSFIGGNDCNDANPAVNPGVSEIQGNGIDDDCNSSTSDIVGILNQPVNSLQISLYPNPNKDGTLHVLLTQPITCTLLMYDGTGRVVMEQSISQLLTTLNIAELSDGVYTVQIMYNNETLLHLKVIKY